MLCEIFALQHLLWQQHRAVTAVQARVVCSRVGVSSVLKKKWPQLPFVVVACARLAEQQHCYLAALL